MDTTGFVLPHAGAALLVFALLAWALVLREPVQALWRGWRRFR